MDDYFKDIANTRDAVERMFNPYKEIIKEVDEQSKEHAKIMQSASNQAQPIIIASGIINEKIELIRKTNKDLAEQIDKVMNPLKDIDTISNDLIIPNFIDSYNSMKELINNFEDYEDNLTEGQSSALNEIKESKIITSNIESKLDNLEDEQKRTFKDYLRINYVNLLTRFDYESITSEINKTFNVYQLSEGLTSIKPEFEGYLIILDVLIIVLSNVKNK